MKPLDITQIITQLYWPAIVFAFIYIFRESIEKLLKERKIKLNLPNEVGVEISSKEAEKALSQLFTEFYIIYHKSLRPDHRAYFHKILNTDTKLHVSELIEGFDRDNKDHIGALRALRGIGLIEPQGGGSWAADSVINVTSFGKVFVDYLNLKEQNA